MTPEMWFAILFGGGGATGLISYLLTRQQNKAKEKFDLLDRLYTEIERLDAIIKELRGKLNDREKELRDTKDDLHEERLNNRELKRLITKLEEEIASVKKKLRKMQEGGGA